MFQNYLVGQMLSYGISINVVRDGRRIFLVEIKDLSIQFVRSNNYFKLNEFQLADMFEISNKKIFFPSHVRDNQHLSEKVPEVDYFFDFEDSEEERVKKINFVNELKQNNKNGFMKRNCSIMQKKKLDYFHYRF